MMSKAGEASVVDGTDSLQDERSAEARRRRAAVLAQDQQSSSEEEDETSDSNRSEEEDTEEEEEEDSVGHPSSQSKPSGAHIPSPQPSQGRTSLLSPASAATAATAAPLAAQHQTAARNMQANSAPRPTTTYPAAATSHAAVPPSQPHMVPSSQSSSHATSSSAPTTSSMDTSARASQNQASAPVASKRRRWNPFARKDPSPRDLDAKIQHYQQKAEAELNKSDTAQGRLQHNNSVVHDSHASIGARISNFFQKFNNWTSQKTHKRSHHSLQGKVSKLEAKRGQQNMAASRPH